jgi:hypothetical protein
VISGHLAQLKVATIHNPRALVRLSMQSQATFQAALLGLVNATCARCNNIQKVADHYEVGKTKFVAVVQAEKSGNWTASGASQ